MNFTNSAKKSVQKSGRQKLVDEVQLAHLTKKFEYNETTYIYSSNRTLSCTSDSVCNFLLDIFVSKNKANVRITYKLKATDLPLI